MPRYRKDDWKPKPKPKLGRIPCILCGVMLPATHRRRYMLERGNRIVCKQCEKTVRRARTLFGSILGRPFREMIAMAKKLEEHAAQMVDGPEIRILAKMDTPAYRDIVAEWSRITGCRVDPLPRQVLLPPEEEEIPPAPPSEGRSAA